jgi:DNA-binding XRE family transcriptional regulator
MRSRNASLKPMANSDLPITRWMQLVPQTGTSKATVIELNFSGKSPSNALGGSADIDALVEELEAQSVENAELIAQGRRWVADNLYLSAPSLARLRLAQGWSQAELARRAGTSQSYVARLERGHIDPQLSTLRKLASVLGVSIEVLEKAMSMDCRA